MLDNLNTHSEGQFPTSEYLSSIVKSGQPVYGTAAIGKSPMSSGALHLIEVVDGLSDDDFLNVQGWGGANLLAEALAHVRSSRTQLDAQKFYGKLRVYTISDQDNTGPWIRANFPTIPYIVSIHGFNQYRLAAWSGISGEKFYNFDVGAIADLWRNGSVIRSWMLDLTAAALKEDSKLDDFSGHVSDSGEGRWALKAAIDLSVPMPSLSSSKSAAGRGLAA